MEQPHRPKLPLVALLAAQTQLSFNAHAAKILVFALALTPGVLAAGQLVPFLAVLPALLALPYLAFSPLVAWLSDRFSSRTMMGLAALLQVAVLGALAFAFRERSLPLVLGGFLLLATLSAVVSPAKRALLREVVSPGGYNLAVGWMEMLTVTAIVTGAYAGARWFDLAMTRLGGPAMAWQAGEWVSLGLAASAFVALLVLVPVGRTPARAAGPLPQELLTQQINHLVELIRSSRLRTSALGILFFYLFGGVLVLALVEAAHDWSAAHGGGAGAVTLAVTLLLLAGVGAVGGSILAAAVSRGRTEVGSVALGAAGMAVGAWLAAGRTVHTLGFDVSLLVLGFSSGLYLAPLYVYFQNRVTPARRTRMIGALNLFRGLGGVAAGGLYYGLTAGLGWTAAEKLGVLAALAAVTAVLAVWIAPEHTLLLVFRGLARVLYRLRLVGTENIPTGGALIISNHISYVDAILLQCVFPRKLWFLALHGPRRRGLPLWYYRVSGVIPLSAEYATEGLRLAIRKMKEGELVCVFPEGQVSRTGALMEIRKGFEVLARRAEVPVVPVFIDSLWGSIFSYSNQKLIWKLPDRLPFRVLVQVGPPLDHAKVDAVLARQALLDLGERAYQNRPELTRHIGGESIRALARHPWKEAIVDCTGEPRSISAGKLLAVAATYAAKLRREVPETRVGIALPPGAGGTIANLAVVLAGKIPVNLNFTVGRAASEASMRNGGVETVISAGAMRAKLPQFPWPEKTRDIKDDLTACPKAAIVGRLALVWLLPARALRFLFGVPSVGGDQEAGLLFTSGSAGEPKGVPLTHRNIIANCGQISATGILPKRETLLGCLPLFHSMGFTVTIWYPIFTGLRLVTVPSPLETKKIIEVVEQQKVSIMVMTPTFLRAILLKADPKQLASLRFIVSGAERLPVDLFEHCLQRFGVKIYQGYGLTETTPVTNVNVPDPVDLPRGVKPQEGHRLGSVGRLMAGMTARIVHPDTGEILPPNHTGVIWFRGPNVFRGYLNDPKRTADALRDGWFVSGDLGRFDEDGFLFIEGRLTRFSKIGGEMVPHHTVEQKIFEVLQLDPASGATAVVVGVPDPAKGEALVVLTTADIDAGVLRERLSAAGLPNLWIPRLVRKIDAVPVLGTGKCDLKGCKDLALKLTAGPA